MSGPHHSPDNAHGTPQLPNGRADGLLPAANAVPLEKLLAYAEKVVAEMANNRDIHTDNQGRPECSLRSSGEDGEASYALFEADFSGLGMATDMPFLATAYADEGFIEWSFGPTPIAKTPRTATPKEAADILEMNTLLSAFRRFVAAESALFPTSLTPPKEGTAVTINPEDGCCPECSGTLEVIGVDDATMTVECTTGCGANYEVEHDAFDGERDYVLEFLAKRGWPEV